MLIPTTPQTGWQILHTKTCLMLEGGHVPFPVAVPLEAGGKKWPVGSFFDFLGGNKTSKAYEFVDFRKHRPAEYIGTVAATVGTIAVFRQAGFAHEDGSPQLFGWVTDPQGLKWTNHENKPRMVELDRATLTSQEVPPLPTKKPGKKTAALKITLWPEWHTCPDCWNVARYAHEQPQPYRCASCGATPTVYRSRFKAERLTFDVLQAEHGEPGTPAPLPATA